MAPSVDDYVISSGACFQFFSCYLSHIEKRKERARLFNGNRIPCWLKIAKLDTRDFKGNCVQIDFRELLFYL